MTLLWSLQLAAWLFASAPSASSVRVAAISYAGGMPRKYGCRSDRCSFETLIRTAARSGAKIVVTAEYALPQREAEPRFPVGTRASPHSAPLQAWLGSLADELELFLGVDLETEDDSGSGFNSFVMFDPHGKIVARHDKIELFEGERQALAAGTSVTTVTTPYGRLGLLICADLYAAPKIHHTLLHDGPPSIIVVSAAWTVPVATRWQAAFAHDWGVHVVAANAAVGGGRGGGVFDDHGRSIGRKGPLTDIVLADIPVAPIHPPAGSNDPR